MYNFVNFLLTEFKTIEHKTFISIDVKFRQSSFLVPYVFEQFAELVRILPCRSLISLQIAQQSMIPNPPLVQESICASSLLMACILVMRMMVKENKQSLCVTRVFNLSKEYFKVIFIATGNSPAASEAPASLPASSYPTVTSHIPAAT